MISITGRCRWAAWALILMGFMLPWAAQGASPEVRILEPVGGVSTDRVVKVQGTVAERTITMGTLVLNGITLPLEINEGTFVAYLTVSPGRNTILAVAANREGVGMDSVTLWSRVPPRDILVLLTWDTPQSDVDLVVTEPGGEQCKPDHRITSTGGILDIDDASGYGPEVYTMPDARPGKYKVDLVYFASRGQAQTVATIKVVLFEGTAQEKRLSSTVLLTQDKEIVPGVDFEVPPR